MNEELSLPEKLDIELRALTEMTTAVLAVLITENPRLAQWNWSAFAKEREQSIVPIDGRVREGLRVHREYWQSLFADLQKALDQLRRAPPGSSQ